MSHGKTYRWITQGERRQRVLITIRQPMTAKQLACKTDMAVDSSSYAIRELCSKDLLYCLNPSSIRSRLYWLTDSGKKFQCLFRKEKNLPKIESNFPQVDWDLYGDICFSHRSAVIKTITEPLQPSEIKRRARQKDPDIRMSANNVRDVIRFFLKKGIVKPITIRRKAHLRYELTELGEKLKILMVQAERMGRE